MIYPPRHYHHHHHQHPSSSFYSIYVIHSTWMDLNLPRVPLYSFHIILNILILILISIITIACRARPGPPLPGSQCLCIAVLYSHLFYWKEAAFPRRPSWRFRRCHDLMNVSFSLTFILDGRKFAQGIGIVTGFETGEEVWELATTPKEGDRRAHCPKLSWFRPLSSWTYKVPKCFIKFVRWSTNHHSKVRSSWQHVDSLPSRIFLRCREDFPK